MEDVIMRDPSERGLRSLTAILAIILALGLFILHFYRFPLDATILDTQVRIVNLESTRAQGVLYMTLIGLFVAVSAAVILRPGANILPAAAWTEQVLAAMVVISTIYFGSRQRVFLRGFLLTAAILVLLRMRWDLTLPSWARSGLARIQQFNGIFYWLLIGIIVAYTAIFVMAPIATPLWIQGAPELRGIEGHYAVTMLPGFDLICCSEMGTIERANYGLGMPLLTAFTLKVLSFFGTPDTALVQAVKINQLIAVAMICVLCFLTNRKYFPYVMSLTLGMTAYMLSNISEAVKYPNQSGIRYIPLLAALIVLVLEMRRAQLRLWLLASASAIFVILSPETGIAATAGYLVAAVLSRYTPRMPITSIAATIMLFGLIFTATGIAGSALIVEPILKNSSGGLFQFLALFAAGGYGGIVAKPSMTAILLFFAATTVVLRSVWRARNGVLVQVDVYESAIGTMMLIWLMYYVNRMAEWNLWFQLVLLALLISPRITPENWRQLFRIPLRSGVTFSMIIACLIGGQMAFSLLQFKNQAMGWFSAQYQGCSNSVILDGMCLPWLPRSKFELQMNALTKEYSPDQNLVLSGVSTYARLHGFNEGFPWYDPMEVVRKKDVDEIVDWIDRRGPKYVLADDPRYDIALAAPEHSDQIQMYLPLLASYREVRRDAGWIVLERVSDHRVDSR